MSFEYISVEDAMTRSGLRMVVLSKVPSPWTEAAKGFFHIKGIEWAAVRLVYDNDALARWAGQLSAPVAVYNDEPPRSGWAEILMLAERLAPHPPLLSLEPAQRGRAVELSDKFCGQNGLGWSRRLQAVHAGLQKTGGFPERIAAYLGKKYGYQPDAVASVDARVCELLELFAAQLRAQNAAGHRYYLGAELSAVDVYSATFMGLFAPLPPEQCDMHPNTRAAFESPDDATLAALDPILLEHRDMMYATHLELPLSL